MRGTVVEILITPATMCRPARRPWCSRPECHASSRHARRASAGYLDEYEPGDIFRHWPGKTITEAEDHMFCLLTMAASPLHIDRQYGETRIGVRPQRRRRHLRLFAAARHERARHFRPCHRQSRRRANCAISRRSFTATRSTARARCCACAHRSRGRAKASSRCAPTGVNQDGHQGLHVHALRALAVPPGRRTA